MIMPADILITRFNAHVKYMAPRIIGSKRKAEFIDAIYTIISNIKDAETDCLLNIKADKHGGVKLALDTAYEILSTTGERFGREGRSGNFYWEKL